MSSPNNYNDDFNIEEFMRSVNFARNAFDAPDEPTAHAAPGSTTGEYRPVRARLADDAAEDAAQPEEKQPEEKQPEEQPEQTPAPKQHPQRKHMRRVRRKPPLGIRILKKLIFMIIWLIAIVIAGYYLARAGWSWANDLLALDKEEVSVTITITNDMFSEETATDEDGNEVTQSVVDIDAVAELLNENGLIEYNWLFKLFATFTNKDASIVAGSYDLTSDMDYSALLRNMGSSSTARSTVTVMVPEGYTLAQIIALLAENGVAEEDDLWDAAANYDFEYDFLDSDTLGDETRLEGYLFPDTYEFYQSSTGSYALNKLLSNFNTKLTASVDQSALAEMEAAGYTVRDLVIVASIIEKETDGTDQAQIASVIYNRLSSNEGGTNGYLQMDSTIQYILDERKDTLTAEDLTIDSPYNTYLYKGLPAGPICNPGLDALSAAVSPDETSYFYFILGDDGNTHFFADYNDFLTFRDAQTGQTTTDEGTDEDEYIEG